MNIIKESEKFAVSKFKNLRGFYKKWYYLHSKYVGIASLKINPRLDKEIMLVSGWLHDVGKVDKNENHAERSAIIAEKFLSGKINKKKLKIILDCIKNHSRTSRPKTKEGKVFQSADKLALLYPRVRRFLSQKMNKYELKRMIHEHYFSVQMPEAKRIANKLLNIINKQKYTFKAYSKEFPKLFEKENVKILKVLPEEKVEHVGSTAVPGLGGKGIIDIAILIPKKKLKESIKNLEKIGYEYRPSREDSERVFLQKIIRGKGKERRVHIHLCISKEFYETFISFREYLRKHPEAKEAYAKVKKFAARQAKGEGLLYHSHKKELIRAIQKKALREYRRTK